MDLTSGQRLKIWRDSTGVSQRKLASTLGYGQSYIGNIEAGRSEPSRNFLISLQEKFGVRADYILYGEGPPIAAEHENSSAVSSAESRSYLLMMFSGAAVQRVCSDATIELTVEEFEKQANWVYEQLVARMATPGDGDEMERVLAVLRSELETRLSGGV